VDPSDPRAALRAAAAAADTIRRRRVSILLFPEGTRNKGAGLGVFKEGAAFIAIKSGAPVVPMALNGTREVLSPGSVYVRSGDVTLALGKPIPTAGLTLKDRCTLTCAMREGVEALLRG
jgi:1-acyl-sn-glycerol-3-phosphate acyltransferase